MIRRYTGEDPHTMDREEWSARMTEASWIRDKEIEMISDQIAFKLTKKLLTSLGLIKSEET